MPKVTYRSKNGNLVPGTTTIVGRFENKAALIQWGGRVGQELGWDACQEALAEHVRTRSQKEWADASPASLADSLLQLEPPKFVGAAIYKVRDEAGDVGTWVHEWIHAHWKGEAYTAVPVDWIAQVQSAFEAFLRWWDQTKLTIIRSEVSLVSERHQYGGTFDALAKYETDGGGKRLVVIDWKTSKDVYPGYLSQLAAYSNLIEEHMGHPVDECTILLFDKKSGRFSQASYERRALEPAWELFLQYRKSYDLDRKVARLV